MIQRALLAVAAVFGFCLVAAVMISYLGGDETLTGEPKKPPADAGAEWDGTAIKPYHLTFNRRGDLLAVDRAQFSNLRRASASSEVVAVASAAGGGRPSWLKAKNFRGYMPTSGRVVRPSVVIRRNGSSWDLRLGWSAIPSASLGPTCAGAEVRDPFVIQMLGLPGGPVALELSAPPAPAGYCFFDPEVEAAAIAAAKRAARAIIVQAVRVKGAPGKPKRVTVRGVSAPEVGRMRVEAGQKGYRPVASAGGRKWTARFWVRSPGKWRLRVGYKSAGKIAYPRRSYRSFRVGR